MIRAFLIGLLALVVGIAVGAAVVYALFNLVIKSFGV